jgi:formyl-CoA transferase
MRTVADLAADPQLDALDMLAPFPHPSIPDLRLVRTPLSVDGQRGLVGTAPPQLGQHTDTILDELGIDHPTRERWREQGVIG